MNTIAQPLSGVMANYNFGIQTSNLEQNQQNNSDWANSLLFSDDTPKSQTYSSLASQKEGMVNKTPELPSSFKYHESAVKTDLFAARENQQVQEQRLELDLTPSNEFSFLPPVLDLAERDEAITFKIDEFTPTKLSATVTDKETLHFSGFPDLKEEEAFSSWHSNGHAPFSFELKAYLCPLCHNAHKAIDITAFHAHMNECSQSQKNTLDTRSTAPIAVNLQKIRSAAGKLDLHERITIIQTLERLAKTMRTTSARMSPLPALSPRTTNQDSDVVSWLYTTPATNNTTDNKRKSFSSTSQSASSQRRRVN